jgi:hypothetical protein
MSMPVLQIDLKMGRRNERGCKDGCRPALPTAGLQEENQGYS